MSEVVSEQAHAKANLFLRVLAREADGYHSLETLFCRLELADTLTARRAEGKGVTLEVEGELAGPAEENLAVRAAEAVLQAVRTPFAVQLTLVKRIPVGAGLGGGSADAAAALRAVNQLAHHAVPRAELFHLAAQLGADVPFCLGDARLALAWGHGERMLALSALPSAAVLLLTPDVAVRTAEAYSWLDAARSSSVRRGALVLDAAALSSWSDVARMAGNDFESVVFARLPAIRDAFEALARTGPLLCRMTGSGSTLFAVYRGERERDEARTMLGRKYGVLTSTRTV
ncbi:MAG TPA: 4-(cytidine 5'-diphospho)-2-C-methyl-D-erythritol kinase [Gemmatimonadales bacterium]|jgi:4-diphosphocytidyl-2-C-methyl-D-erythritol kinase|nr:4-(cytidine 5'-diphospho)-2-C-methyl-D-erythritol kinase [Gemmatimonadales bacterium]